MEANFVRNTKFNHDCLRRECKMDLKFWERETSKAKSIKIWKLYFFLEKSHMCREDSFRAWLSNARSPLPICYKNNVWIFEIKRHGEKHFKNSKRKICWKNVLIHALLEKAILLLQSDLTLLGRVCSRAHRPLLRCEKQSKSETKSLQKQHI